MEISATSSSSTAYLPPQLAEPRVAKNVAREISGTQDAGLPGNAGRLKATETSKGSDSLVAKSARSERENQQAAQASEAQRAQQQEIAIAAGGSIKLDIEDGDRVLKVFDSKDVLIYQLPPKGALMLIKAQENAQQSQVQTSA